MTRNIVALILFSSFLQAYTQNLTTEIDSLMQALTKNEKLHGCVAYVQQNKEVLHFKPYGFRDIERNKKMENDAVFRIASMTKVLTAAGALKLYEEGKFLLDDPLKKYMPQFANTKTMQYLGTDSARVAELKRDITIRDLFRHTAGFGMDYSLHEHSDTIDKLYVENKLSSTEQTAEQFIHKIAKIPLKYSPGEKWLYSYSSDILGFLIEEITNKTLHEYLSDVLFIPLEMNSTGFYVKKKDVKRFSANYYYNDGKQELIDDPFTSDYLKLPTIYSGGGGFENNEGGVVTTAQDFANFCNMLLNYGKFNGKQILKPQTVELMISNQIAGIDQRGFPVSGFGLGMGVLCKNNSGSTKSVFWSGGPYNTTFTIDYEKQAIAIFLTQNSPWWHLAIIEKFGDVVNRNLSY